MPSFDALVCAGLGVSRASYYRKQKSKQEPKPQPKPVRALSNEERQQILELLHSERFVDQSPQEVYATLLDEGTFLCSIRTMYRLLAEHAQVRERRNPLRHPNDSKPELLTTGAKMTILILKPTSKPSSTSLSSPSSLVRLKMPAVSANASSVGITTTITIGVSAC
nr:MAG: helix-turn-helix domain-containing protein [Leptolyngbya sp. IPPAS B-1204]